MRRRAETSWKMRVSELAAPIIVKLSSVVGRRYLIRDPTFAQL